MIRAIFFDLDGTLIDSEPLALKAITECCAQWGLAVNEADAASVAGKKWEVAFELLYGKYRFPLPREEASQKIIARYQALVSSEIREVPGAREAVQALSKEFSLALVSGSHRRDVLWALNHLGITSCFSLVLGAEDYLQSKPAPDGYQKALAHFALAPREAVVFEDSEAGLASARALGIPAVAISSTNHFGHDQGYASVVVPDLAGVNPHWLRAHFTPR
jgi:HAD superfamily hydrolase (TIGR01509 family)